MPVRLKPKEDWAIVDEKIVDLVMEIRDLASRKLRKQLTQLKTEHKNARDWRKKAIENQILSAQGRIRALNTEGSGDIQTRVRRGGRDDILLRMKRLPFEKFYIKERIGHDGNEQKWIIGLTKDIFSDVKGRNVASGRYHHGKYFIAIDINSLGTRNVRFHLIPQRAPDTSRRHMHHMADPVDSKNPLDFVVRNCLGGFNGAIQGSFESADVPELFRILYAFTERLNPSSPLTSLRSLPHVSMVPKEQE